MNHFVGLLIVIAVALIQCSHAFRPPQRVGKLCRPTEQALYASSIEFPTFGDDHLHKVKVIVTEALEEQRVEFEKQLANNTAIFDTRLASVNAELASLNSELDDLKAKQDDLKAKQDDLKAKQDDLKAKQDDLNASLDDLEAWRDWLTDAMKDLDDIDFLFSRRGSLIHQE